MKKKLALLFCFVSVVVWHTLAQEPEKDVLVKDSLQQVTQQSFAPVQERQIPNQKVQALKNSDDFWYADSLPPKNKAVVNRTPDFSSLRYLKYAFWLLMAGIAGYVLYALIKLQIAKGKSGSGYANNSLVEEPGVNFRFINFQTGIEAAVAAKAWRRALRFLYLQTLQRLHAQNKIKYEPDLPNSFYVRQLKGSSEQKDFIALTRIFEWTWYGHFEPSEEQFYVWQKRFENFGTEVAA